MTQILHAFAPAKINLFLHILGRKPNGYHNLQTIFQLIDFGDELTFQATKENNVVLTAENCWFPMEDNLVYRAAMLLKQQFNYHKGAKIHLKKNVPSGGGLGGGSSDAGATLRTLNQLWQLNASQDELLTLALKLGADVPVFVLNQNAWAEGVGELLTPMELPVQDYIILDPHCSVNTTDIYQHPSLPRNTEKITRSSYNFEQTHNDFETLVCKLYPPIGQALSWLKKFGSARLTGTGGCVFLPLSSKILGEQIKAQVPPEWSVILCSSIK